MLQCAGGKFIVYGEWNDVLQLLSIALCDNGVLQCVAVCCSVLQCIGGNGIVFSEWEDVSLAPSDNGVLQCVASCCSALHRVAVCCCYTHV